MRTHIRSFTHVCMYMYPCTRRKSVQRYNFFLTYANFSKEKCKKSSFFLQFVMFRWQNRLKNRLPICLFRKIIVPSARPFPLSGWVLSWRTISADAIFPPKIRSRPAEYMQAARFFAYRFFRRL